MSRNDQAARRSATSHRAQGVQVAERAILDGVSLGAAPGRMLVVTGPAGSGKTTLLHVLAGIISPSQGEATLDGMSARVSPSLRRLNRLCPPDLRPRGCPDARRRTSPSPYS